MQLEKDERSILAYFPSSARAQQAASELKRAGLLTDPGSLQIDRISRYGYNSDAEYNNPINHAVNLTGVTLYSSGAAPEGVDPALAADNSSSGIGAAGYGTAGGKAFLLTVVTARDRVDEAVHIIKTCGGKV